MYAKKPHFCAKDLFLHVSYFGALYAYTSHFATHTDGIGIKQKYFTHICTIYVCVVGWCWCIVVIIKIGLFLNKKREATKWYDDDKMSASLCMMCIERHKQKMKCFDNLLKAFETVSQSWNRNTFRKLNQKVSHSSPFPYILALNMLNFTLRICWRFLRLYLMYVLSECSQRQKSRCVRWGMRMRIASV